MKFLPAYLFAAEIGGGQNIKIAYPEEAQPDDVGITLHFEIRRGTMASAQTATFRLYNLGEKTRDLLQQDWFNLQDIRAVQFSAGYQGNPLTRLFNGQIKQAQSSKASGATEGVTEIEAMDSGSTMANGTSLRSVASDLLFTDLLKNLGSDLPGIDATAFIGQFPGKTLRGSAYAGNSWSYIFQLSDGLAFIDNNQLKILQPNEYIGVTIPQITSASGLLGSPRRYLNMMQVTILFEPQFVIGQLVDLQSQILPKFNGRYKIMGLTHRGIISPSQDGERITELTLWNGLGGSSSWVGPVAPITLQ